MKLLGLWCLILLRGRNVAFWMIPKHGACGARAEFVFKVSDDFSNFIQIFTVAVEIARDFIVKYGRWEVLSALFYA